MKTGRIDQLINDKGFGFITSDDGGERVFFHARVVCGASFDGLEEGLEIEYEAEVTERGPQATLVEVPQYRFLNPYNFVRPLDPAPNSTEEGELPQATSSFAELGAMLQRSPEVFDSTVPETDIKLLGRCHPPPHDRYVGLSGRIRCEMEAKTPLFISDSEGICVQENGHKSYRFFRFDNERALPATSLRGPIRAVFEAVTHSCFAIFKGEERLSYRLKPQDALEWIPAGVERGTDDELKLRLLPGATEISQQPSPLYAAWVPLYNPLQASSTVRRDPHSNYAVTRAPIPLSAGLRHGDECAALIELIEYPKRPHFQFWTVLELNTDPTLLTPPDPTKRQRIIPNGCFCRNNQNIENKHDERYFFRDASNASLPQPLPIGKWVEEDYNKLIDEYQERHRDAVKEREARGLPLDQPVRNDPAFSRFIPYKVSAHLADGDLVYAKLSETQRNPRVDYLIPVAVGRIFYGNSIGDLLSESLDACGKYEDLCPACRTFGWVKDAYKEKSTQKDDSSIRTAYRGRLVFTHGKLIEFKGELPPTPLAILSSPKPTTTRFYLMPQDGQPQNGFNSEQAGYHQGNMLRGRKFHRHHGVANPSEYQREGGIKNDQNRTVRDALQPGAKFCFMIEFSNLAPLEFGALLWTLELEGKGYHRLGYAKPLGFGSVKLIVKELSILEPAQRYRLLDNNGWKTVDKSKWQTWVEQFKQAMAAKYGEPSFDHLPNVRDLLALLGEPQIDLPIHYPRSTPYPQEEGKNFEWFVGNNREPRGPLYALKLATEDDSLPLLDKDGNEV